MATGNGTVTGPRKSIVVIDNDRLVCETLCDLLGAEGYAVNTAADGLEGLSAIWEVRPDYIIMDVVLPKLHGGLVCAAVRQDPRLQHTPVIAFSSLSPSDYRLFPQLDVDAYVAKGSLPSAARHLLTAISQCGEGEPARTRGEHFGYEGFRPRRLVNGLLHTQRHLEAILRILAPGAVELDRDGRIVWANPGACEFLEMTQGELIGELFVALVPQEDQRRLRSLLADLVRSGESTQRMTAFHLGGAVVPVRLAPIMEDNACSGTLLMLEGRAGVSEMDPASSDSFAYYQGCNAA